MNLLKPHAISMVMLLSILCSSGLGADTSALQTVQVASSEEVSSWKLKFETLAEFKLAMDRAIGCDGVAVKAGATNLFAAIVDSKKSDDKQLLWAVHNPGGIGFSGYGVFVDREGKRIKQFTLGPDPDGGQRFLKMVRVEFTGKDRNGNEVSGWEYREIDAKYTTMKDVPDSAVAVVVQFGLRAQGDSTDGKENSTQFMLALPPAKPKNDSSR